jgi:RNA polymerase sigma factor (sigma-70 family)
MYDRFHLRLCTALRRQFPHVHHAILEDAARDAITNGATEENFGLAITIATRKTIDALDKEKRNVPLNSISEDAVSYTAEFEDHISIRLDSLEMLKVLTPPEREAVLMRHLLDFKVSEIATICGVSENSLKDRLKSGMQRMREKASKERGR